MVDTKNYGFESLRYDTTNWTSLIHTVAFVGSWAYAADTDIWGLN
jgi:hypothetical protein